MSLGSSLYLQNGFAANKIRFVGYTSGNSSHPCKSASFAIEPPPAKPRHLAHPDTLASRSTSRDPSEISNCAYCLVASTASSTSMPMTPARDEMPVSPPMEIRTTVDQAFLQEIRDQADERNYATYMTHSTWYVAAIYRNSCLPALPLISFLTTCSPNLHLTQVNPQAAVRSDPQKFSRARL
jgi:hypothetical protein